MLRYGVFLLLMGFLSCLAPMPLMAAGTGGGHGGDSHSGGEAKKSESGGIFSTGPVYVNTPQIIMPILLESGPEQIITFNVAVQVKDLGTSDKVRAVLPRLVDAYFKALYGRLNEQTLIGGKVVDIEFMKSRLQTATQNILGDIPYEDVLIQNLVQRIL